MPAPYRIYSHIGHEVSACSHYRIIQPLKTMETLGLPVEIILDQGDGRVWSRERMAAFLESDFSLSYQGINSDILNLMITAKALTPMRDHGLQMRWPPTMVVDTDDDIFNVMPFNVAYGSLGTRDALGNPLKDGDEIGAAHPLESADAGVALALNKAYPSPLLGARGDYQGRRYIYDKDGLWREYLPLWKDGSNMNIEANRQKMDIWRKIMREANLITCSTPNAEAYVKRELGDSAPSFVQPNSINPDDYPEVELREHPGEVRIMWQGSSSHQEDLWPLTEAMARVAKKYPQATWYFFGSPYKWAYKNLPAERVKFLPWVAYQAYTTRLSMIGHDINLCPLRPYIFNQSRSAIKWYESSAICRPAATLAQRTGSYAAEIVEGEMGLLWDTTEEFETKLGALIESEELRKKLATTSKEWVRENRDSKKLTLKMFQKWVETREEQKMTMEPREELPFDAVAT